jgi:hypothetical protein
LRIVVVAVVIELFAVATAIPRHWVASRIRYHADAARPRYDVPIEHSALVRAGRVLHRAGGTYYVYVPRGAPVLRGNIDGALGLWAVPALPLAWAVRPDWVLSYGTKDLLPGGLRAARVYTLGPRIHLVRVAT